VTSLTRTEQLQQDVIHHSAITHVVGNNWMRFLAKRGAFCQLFRQPLS